MIDTTSFLLVLAVAAAAPVVAYGLSRLHAAVLVPVVVVEIVLGAVIGPDVLAKGSSADSARADRASALGDEPLATLGIFGEQVAQMQAAKLLVGFSNAIHAGRDRSSLMLGAPRPDRRSASTNRSTSR